MADSRSLSSRIADNMGQFLKFGMVGGSGTVVNMVAMYIITKLLGATMGVHEEDVVFPLFGTDFNVRWYNLITMLAFLIANMWNYQLNRMWTFKHINKVSWWRGFFPFLATGLGAMVFQQIVLVLLMNPTSPIALPRDIFDGTTGLRTPLYYATALSIVAAMPINFVINKLWTFRSKPKTPRVVAESEPSSVKN